MNNHCKLKILIACCILLLSGCIAVFNQDTNKETQANTPRINITTPTAIQTVTPHLSSSEIENFIRKLSVSNGGCEFPCFWGIYPGRDLEQDVIERLSPYGDFVDGTENDYLYDRILFKVHPPEDIDIYSEGEWDILIGVQDNSVKFVVGDSPNITPYINPTLNALLEHLGAPKEIWIQLTPDMLGDPSYDIKLFYPEKGTIVHWSGSTQTITETLRGITVSVCPQNFVNEIDMVQHFPPRFLFWSPDEQLSFPEFNKKYFGRYFVYESYHLLSYQNSDTDVDKFYETYLDPKTEECFQYTLGKKE